MSRLDESNGDRQEKQTDADLGDDVKDAISRDRARTDGSRDPGASRWCLECDVGDARDEEAGDRRRVNETQNKGRGR
jgi:hypothetical protein